MVALEVKDKTLEKGGKTLAMRGSSEEGRILSLGAYASVSINGKSPVFRVETFLSWHQVQNQIGSG